MPVLDKLTTIINWAIDLGSIKQYEIKLNEVEQQQAEVAASADSARVHTNGLGDEAGIAAGLLDSLGDESKQAVASIKRVGQAANRSSNEMTGMNDSTRRASGNASALGRSTDSATKNIKALGRSADSAGNDFEEFGREVSQTGRGLLTVTSIASGLISTLGMMSIKETSKNVMLAKSVGMTTEAYLGWEGVMKRLHFDGEKTVDLMEEMTNKLGELSSLGKMSSAEDSLKMLNIQFRDIKDLAPEEQFMTIMEAAKSMSDGQQAISAVDMIFGGDANKIMGLLRQYDGSVRDIVESYRQINFMTDRGVEGSLSLSASFDNLTTVGQSLFTETLGRAGEQIAPVIDGMLEWAAANKDLINQNIDSLVGDISDAFEFLAWSGEKVAGVVEELGGFGNAIKLLGGGVGVWKAADLVTSLSKGVGPLKDLTKNTELFSGALSLLGKAPALLAITGFFLAMDDLRVFLTGGKSFYGEWTEKVIPDVELAMLEFFGVLDEGMDNSERQIAIAEFQQSFLSAIDSIENGAIATFNTLDSLGAKANEIVTIIFTDWKGITREMDLVIVGFFSNMKETAFSFSEDSKTFIIDMFSEMRDVVENYLSDFVSFINSLANKVASFIKGIPVLGGLVGEIPGLTPVAVSSMAGGTPTATSDSATMARPYSSKVINTDNSKYSLTAPVTVNVTPGMDAEAVGREVSDQLAAQFSNIKTTGIKR